MALDKRLRRRAFWVGKAQAWAHASRPWPQWASRAQPCVVHYHTKQAHSTTPPSNGRWMPPWWLPRNQERKARVTKASALKEECHWKGRPEHVCVAVFVGIGGQWHWQVLDEDKRPEPGDCWHTSGKGWTVLHAASRVFAISNNFRWDWLLMGYDRLINSNAVREYVNCLWPLICLNALLTSAFHVL